MSLKAGPSSVPKPERECFGACRSKQHGTQCVAAATQRGVTDRQIAAYLYHLCANFAKKHDEVGRMVLHSAASCGKTELCQWLLTCAGANPNSRDYESGYTPLHRAIYYGHIDTAVRILQFGGKLDICDNEDMTVLDILSKEQASCSALNLSAKCQAYVWGSNKNYSLGTGSDNTRKIPELLDFTKLSINQVALEELHSIYVSSCGKVWSCGMGQGGRLGTGSNNSFLTPHQIKTKDHSVLSAAVAVNHTLLLLDNDTVLTFGSNIEHQLGVHPWVESVLSPRQVFSGNFTTDQPIKGVLAAKYHSVFYCESAVYTCGLNAGQHGRYSNTTSFITQPNKVSLNLNGRKITNVATSTGAIVVAVNNGDIYLLHKFQCKKMTSKMLDVVKIGCIGGSIEYEGVSEPSTELKVVILNSRGIILLWREGSKHPSKCIYGSKQFINVNDFCLTQEHILLVTKDGTAFQGSFTSTPRINVLSSSNSKGNQFHKFVERSECYSVKLKRLPNIFRGVAVNADPRGVNYAVIQTHPKSSLTDLPVISDSEMPQQMATLLEEASEHDSVHDAVIKVGGRIFAVHRFMLFNGGAGLLVDEISKQGGVLILKDTNPYIFHQVLTHLYTGKCELISPGPFDTRQVGKREDPLKLALELCNRFRITTLASYLHKLRYERGSILLKDGSNESEVRLRFDRKAGNDLFDVTIKSEDGATIKAHRCVLTARLDYFHSMFLGGWAETGRECVIPLPFPFRVLKDLIDFIYTDDLPILSLEDDLDHVIRLLIAGDQLLMSRLRESCELELIDALTLKNAPTVLHLASLYNAPQLKVSTIQFISLNLASFLQSRLLEPLDDTVLAELSDYYRKNSEKIYRVLTPMPGVPYPELLESAPPIPWPAEFVANDKGDVSLELKSPQSSSKKKRSKKSLNSTAEPIDVDTISSSPCERFMESVNIASDTEDVEPVEIVIAKSPPSEKTATPDIKWWEDSLFPVLDGSAGKQSKHRGVRPSSRPDSSRKLFSVPIKLYLKERERLTSESEKQHDSTVLASSPPAKPPRTWAVLPPLPTPNSDGKLVEMAPEESDFVNIMAHDKEKKANLAKMKSKPFNLIQIEEKTIEELLIFYNAANEFDERITVQRHVTSSNIDTPHWATAAHPRN